MCDLQIILFGLSNRIGMVSCSEACLGQVSLDKDTSVEKIQGMVTEIREVMVRNNERKCSCVEEWRRIMRIMKEVFSKLLVEIKHDESFKEREMMPNLIVPCCGKETERALIILRDDISTLIVQVYGAFINGEDNRDVFMERIVVDVVLVLYQSNGAYCLDSMLGDVLSQSLSEICIRDWKRIVSGLFTCENESFFHGDDVQLSVEDPFECLAISLYNLCRICGNGLEQFRLKWLDDARDVEFIVKWLVRMLCHFGEINKLVAVCCLEMLFNEALERKGLMDSLIDTKRVLDVYKLLCTHTTFRENKPLVQKAFGCLAALVMCFEKYGKELSSFKSKEERKKRSPSYGKALPMISLRDGSMELKCLQRDGSLLEERISYADEILEKLLRVMKYEDGLVLRFILVQELQRFVRIMGERCCYWLKYILPVLLHYIKSGTAASFSNHEANTSAVTTRHTQGLAVLTLLETAMYSKGYIEHWKGHMTEAILFFVIQMCEGAKCTDDNGIRHLLSAHESSVGVVLVPVKMKGGLRDLIDERRGEIKKTEGTRHCFQWCKEVVELYLGFTCLGSLDPLPYFEKLEMCDITVDVAHLPAEAKGN